MKTKAAYKTLYCAQARTGVYQAMVPYSTVAKEMLQYVPYNHGETWVWMKDNYTTIANYEQDFVRLAKAVFELYPQGLPAEWLQEWEQVENALTAEARKYVDLDLTKLLLEELWEKYERLLRLDLDMWKISIFIDAFDVGYDQEKIDEIIKKHDLTGGETDVLLMPKTPSYVRAWGEALQKFQNGLITVADIKRDYFWYGVNYSSFYEVGDAFIQKEIHLLHEPISAEAALTEAEVLAAHGLDHNPLQFFQTITTWRDERKRLNYTGLYGLVKILREVCRHHGIDPLLINALTPLQARDFFEGKIAQSTLESQLHDGVLFYISPEGEPSYIFGAKGEERWSTVYAQITSNTQTVEEIRGTSASKGVVTGQVRVILDFKDPKADEFTQGDILVTSMTRPEFMSLMKKCGAIITDEGGITSHAAIVARELKKPCIIGTKIATQVLHDGDLVEVDADNGVVKILK